MQPPAHLSGFDAFGQRIDRNEPSGVHGLGVGPFERWLAELKRSSEPSDFARDPHTLPFAMRLLDERPSEPGRAYVRRGPVLLRELRLGHELAGRGGRRRNTNEGRDRRLRRVRYEAAEGDELGKIVEARGQVPEKVADRVDLHAPEELRGLRPYPGDAGDRKIERCGRRVLGRSGAGCGRRHVQSMVPRLGQRWNRRRSRRPKGPAGGNSAWIRSTENIVAGVRSGGGASANGSGSVTLSERMRTCAAATSGTVIVRSNSQPSIRWNTTGMGTTGTVRPTAVAIRRIASPAPSSSGPSTAMVRRASRGSVNAATASRTTSPTKIGRRRVGRMPTSGKNGNV